MLAHVSIQVADVDASAAFYAAVFAPLGVHEVMRVPRENGAVVGLAGQDDVHTAALMAGADILHEPRRWPECFPATTPSSCAIRTATTSKP